MTAANAPKRPRRKVAPDTARQQLLDEVRNGRTIQDALQVVGRSRSWYDEQRRSVEGFAVKMDAFRNRSGDNAEAMRAKRMPFAEWREKYMFARVWPHMQNAVDLLEGREPSWLHPAFTYEKGTAGNSRILLNVPPNHGKTQVLTIDYVTYLIAHDPDISIILISKTQDQARKFVYAVKQRLTHPKYAEFQMAYGPPDGWRATADEWSATKIYLAGERDSDSKDPTLEALGVGGMIYGARAKVVIADDVVTLSNAAEFEKQRDWLRQEVASRLPPSGGRLLVVGTRVAAVDLYKELRNADHYTGGRVPWTYLAMPAVLSSDSDDPSEWETLWPKTEMPGDDEDVPDDDGLYDRWTGPRMDEVRNEAGPSKWSLVYQNLDIPEDAIFNPVCVRGAVNGMRKPGPLVASGATGMPANPGNFYRVIGIDPAMSGDTAAVAYAVDRRTKKRYVMDVRVITSPTPQAIRDLIFSWSELYKPNSVIVESNAFQLFLTQDEAIRDFLASRGIAYRPHFTGANKQDPDFGVASVAPLFGTLERKSNDTGVRHAGDNLLELPDIRSEGVKKLVEQLITWRPNVRGSKLKMDAVMALWFCEIVAREVLYTTENAANYFESEWTSAADREARYVMDLDQMFTDDGDGYAA